MKRIKNIFLLFILLMGILFSNAYALDEIPAYYTDIKSYINISPIPSVNINGQTYVLIEELNKYGFEVIWNENDRTLTVNKGEYVPNDEIITDEGIPGELSFNGKETDIRLVIEGTQFPCFWSEKGIITHFDNLGHFGSVRWYEQERKIRVVTGVYEHYVNFPDMIHFYFEEFPDVPTPEAVGAPKYESKYADSELLGVIYAYPRKDITQEMYQAYIEYLTDSGFIYRANVNWDSNIWFQKESTLMLIGVDDDYFYVKVFFESTI